MGLPAIAMAMMATGTGLEAYGALREGKESAKAGKHAQLMAERRAKIAEARGLDEIRLLKERGKELKARQIVDIAARGGTLTGTNLKAIVKSAANIEADAAVIAQSTQLEADTFRYQGAQARYQGRLARYGSRIRAATAIGKGIGSALMFSHLIKGLGRGTEIQPGIFEGKAPWWDIFKKGSKGAKGGTTIKRATSAAKRATSAAKRATSTAQKATSAG
jgi:hypothetical protein